MCHAIQFRLLRGANVVTYPVDFGGVEFRVSRRVATDPFRFTQLGACIFHHLVAAVGSRVANQLIVRRTRFVDRVLIRLGLNQASDPATFDRYDSHIDRNGSK